MLLRKSLPALVALVALLGQSCVNTRKTAYFVDQQNATLTGVTAIPETIIQKNDILGISVSSANAEATAVFNAPNLSYASASSVANGGTLQSSGYLVDATGNIQFPVVGNIAVSGLTGNQLRQKIVKELSDRKLLVDPIVSVRYLNFKVTVLGEVARPNVVNVPNEKITLLEALGLAGDLTIYGRRDNVMIIREENGQKTVARVNLNTSELFNSPFYYLKSSDIVYVEPNKNKVASSGRSNVILPVIFGGLSFAAIVIDRLTRKD